MSSSQGPALSVMVPTGVLKRQGAAGASNAADNSAADNNKSVMFSDGIRPGASDN